MSSSPQAWGQHIALQSASISQDIEHRLVNGVTNAAESQEYIVRLLQSFDRDVAGLDEQGREAILSVFRKQLSVLLIQLRTEAAIMSLRSSHRR